MYPPPAGRRDLSNPPEGEGGGAVLFTFVPAGFRRIFVVAGSAAVRACGICRASFVFAGGAAMPRVVIWNASRDDVLRAAVRMYGRRWRLVAVAVGGECSDRAARHRWDRGFHAGGVVPLL